MRYWSPSHINDGIYIGMPIKTYISSKYISVSDID